MQPLEMSYIYSQDFVSHVPAIFVAVTAFAKVWCVFFVCVSLCIYNWLWQVDYQTVIYFSVSTSQHNTRHYNHLVSSHGREKEERDPERKAAEEEGEIAGGPLLS